MRHEIEPKNWIYVKGYELFMFFAKDIGKNKSKSIYTIIIVI